MMHDVAVAATVGCWLAVDGGGEAAVAAVVIGILGEKWMGDGCCGFLRFIFLPFFKDNFLHNKLFTLELMCQACDGYF